MPETNLSSKEKAAIAEAAIIADLLRRGLHVAIPFGDYNKYDLLFSRPIPDNRVQSGPHSFERVQVKYCRFKDGVIVVRARSHSVTAGKVHNTYTYGPDDAEWIAVFDADNGKCYYIPTIRLVLSNSGCIRLRIDPPKNGQEESIRWAHEYESLEHP